MSLLIVAPSLQDYNEVMNLLGLSPHQAIYLVEKLRIMGLDKKTHPVLVYKLDQMTNSKSHMDALKHAKDYGFRVMFIGDLFKPGVQGPDGKYLVRG